MRAGTSRRCDLGCANTEKKGICESTADEKILAKACWCAIFRGD
jgi:hypothetical protein